MRATTLRPFTARSASLTLLIASLLLASPVTSPAQTEKPSTGTEQLVKVNVIVTDRAEHAVNDVRKEDFQLFEEGVAQAISYFALDERPVTAGFLIDASGSVRRNLNYLIDAAKLSASGLRDGDEGFVARFVDRDNFRIIEPMTSDRQAIEDALDDIYVEGGQTAVHDAVDKALKYFGDNQTGDANSRRRVLILVTDGEDRASRLKDGKALLAQLRQSDVQVFVLGLTKFSGLQSSAGKALDLLNGIAEQTGGRAFFPDYASGLPDAAKEIARELHLQYTLGYAGKTSGGERKIQVKWVGRTDQGRRKVIARPTIMVK
jgi:Ca-activated chloride channel family protein